MEYPGSDVRFLDVISTWPGRIYVGVLVGLTTGLFGASTRMPPDAGEPQLSVALSVAMFAFLVATGVTAFYLPRPHLLWILSRNVLAAVVAFVLAVAAMWFLGITTTAGIYGTPFLRLLLSSVTALLLAEALTVIAFVLASLLRGAGGNGKTPEERVLDDDLDL
jgi:hypothetical protein